MLIIYTILTFVCAFFGIAIGYHDSIAGLNIESLASVVRALPIFKTALLFAILPVLNCIIAFYSSEGRYEHYKYILMALVLTTPGAVQLLMLPGFSHLPDNVNGYSLFSLVFLPQGIVAWIIKKRMWEEGGRSSDA